MMVTCWSQGFTMTTGKMLRLAAFYMLAKLLMAWAGHLLK